MSKQSDAQIQITNDPKDKDPFHKKQKQTMAGEGEKKK
jgi:hypothetical protein